MAESGFDNSGFGSNKIGTLPPSHNSFLHSTGLSFAAGIQLVDERSLDSTEDCFPADSSRVGYKYTHHAGWFLDTSVIIAEIVRRYVGWDGL